MSLQNRWNILKDKDAGLPSFRILYPNIPNADLWFKQNILSSKEGEKLLKSLEEYDKERLRKIQIEKTRAYKKDQWAEVRKRRNIILQSTDWSQLADAPIDSAKKKAYRNYRQYLRDIPILYVRPVGVNIVSFEEFVKGAR